MRSFWGGLYTNTAILMSLLFSSTAVLAEKWDMETRHYSSYGWSPSGTEPIMSEANDPACSGEKSIRVDLNYKTSKSSYRAELTNIQVGDKKFLDWGKEYWVGMSYYIPENWQFDDPSRGDIVFQLHQDPDDNENWRNPSAVIRIKGNQWQVQHLSDARKITPFREYQTSSAKDLGPVSRGQWTNVVLQFKTSFLADGMMNVWINGEQKYAYTGPIFFNDVKGPYIKMGVYKPYWKNRSDWGGASAFDSRQLFIDDFRAIQGRDQLAYVSSSCSKPVLPPTAPGEFSVE